MKAVKEVFVRLRKGDFAVIGVVVLLSLTLFAFSFFSSEKLRAEVYLDGESCAVVNLYELEEGQVLKAGNCEILLEKDGASFISSECTDRLCINRGKLTKAGDSMACVPERVSLVLRQAKGGVDAVVF